MAIATYAELTDEVKRWLNRDDPDTINSIPAFINFAEKEIFRVLKLPSYEKLVELKLEHNKAEVPYDLVQLIEIYTKDNRAGRHTSHRELLRHRSGDLKHDSFYYARVGNNYHFHDGDDLASTEVYCHYFQDPPELSYNNQVTPLLQTAPDLLLFTALRHGSVFAEDVEKAQYWEQRSDNAMQEIMKQLEDDNMSGSPQVVERIYESETGARVIYY